MAPLSFIVHKVFDHFFFQWIQLSQFILLAHHSVQYLFHLSQIGIRNNLCRDVSYLNYGISNSNLYGNLVHPESQSGGMHTDYNCRWWITIFMCSCPSCCAYSAFQGANRWISKTIEAIKKTCVRDVRSVVSLSTQYSNYLTIRFSFYRILGSSVAPCLLFSVQYSALVNIQKIYPKYLQHGNVNYLKFVQTGEWLKYIIKDIGGRGTGGEEMWYLQDNLILISNIAYTKNFSCRVLWRPENGLPRHAILQKAALYQGSLSDLHWLYSQ